MIRLTEDGDVVAIIGNPESVSTQDREKGALDELEKVDRTVLSGYNYEAMQILLRISCRQSLFQIQNDKAVVLCR